MAKQSKSHKVSKTVTVQLNREVWREVKHHAINTDETIGDLLTRAWRMFLKIEDRARSEQKK